MDMNTIDTIINCVEKTIELLEKLYIVLSKFTSCIQAKLNNRKNKLKTNLSTRLKKFRKTL